MDPLVVLGLALLGGLAFANGANDVSKGVATLVGGGVADDRRAIAWGALWTAAGAVAATWFSAALVRTFSDGIVAPPVQQGAIFTIAVIGGATGWVALASRLGLPVSTTHAITGALVGAALAAGGWRGVQWASLLHKIALPLAFSPMLAIVLALLVHPVVGFATERWSGRCFCLVPGRRMAADQTGLLRLEATAVAMPAVDAARCADPAATRYTFSTDRCHWLTSGLTSFARGLNDSPKIAALAAGLGLAAGAGDAAGVALFLVVAAAIALGSMAGGRRVTTVLAERVTRMDHVQGFAANLTTALLVAAASRFGLPVSTTHVSSGAIIGSGLARGGRGVNLPVVVEFVTAWLLTLPVGGLLAALIWWSLGE